MGHKLISLGLNPNSKPIQEGLRLGHEPGSSIMVMFAIIEYIANPHNPKEHVPNKTMLC